MRQAGLQLRWTQENCVQLLGERREKERFQLGFSRLHESEKHKSGNVDSINRAGKTVAAGVQVRTKREPMTV